jgi:hypothetical protein
MTDRDTIRDEEKLIRHIAESDPCYDVETLGGDWVAICFQCKARKPDENYPNRYLLDWHADGCWYVWCCEWGEEHDTVAFYGEYHKFMQKLRDDEQNTGDETG